MELSRLGLVVPVALIAAGASALLSVGCGANSSSSSSTSHTPPRVLRAPTIVGVMQAGQRVSALAGSWSPGPASYSYIWRRCDATGKRCKQISAASASTYALGGRDIGATLRVSVIASNRAGASPPELSARTEVVTRSEGTLHLEYVFNDGPVSVYDIDHGFKLVESFTLAGTRRGVRGVAVSPRTHMMFV